MPDDVLCLSATVQRCRDDVRGKPGFNAEPWALMYHFAVQAEGGKMVRRVEPVSEMFSKKWQVLAEWLRDTQARTGSSVVRSSFQKLGVISDPNRTIWQEIEERQKLVFGRPDYPRDAWYHLSTLARLLDGSTVTNRSAANITEKTRATFLAIADWFLAASWDPSVVRPNPDRTGPRMPMLTGRFPAVK